MFKEFIFLMFCSFSFDLSKKRLTRDKNKTRFLGVYFGD